MFNRYVVKKGDTLYSIANDFGTTVENLKDMNNMYYDTMLRQGTEIIVPSGTEKYFDYYTIKQGDNLYQIARRYNINPELLANMNGLDMDDYIYPNQELLIPKGGYSYYITMEGDTLDTVAKRFNDSPNKILEENQTIYLLPGQLLVRKRQN